MAHGTLPVRFDNVLLLRTGMTFRVCIGQDVVNVPPLRVLEGTTIRSVGDVGVLVLPFDVVESLGLGSAPVARR